MTVSQFLIFLQSVRLFRQRVRVDAFIQQGGVAVDDEKVTDVYANVPKSAFEKGYVVIKKGKKKFHKAVL